MPPLFLSLCLTKNTCIMKRCPKCGRILPETSFAINRSAKDGLAFYCKECHNKAQNEARARKRHELREAITTLTPKAATMPAPTTEVPTAMETRTKMNDSTPTNLEGVKSVYLLEELRRRGYRGTLELTRSVRV
jgi:DNA-directed RNA polymerase subunit M/transcription elongation factor TFIIS